LPHDHDVTAQDFDSLWDYERPERSEARFRELLPALADTSRQLELMTQIARAQGLQRRFDEAHATLDAVERRLHGAAHEDRTAQPRPRIRLLLERGRVWNSSGSPERARPLFLSAWDHARGAGEDALAVDAAHMVAIVEAGDEKLAWNVRALELAEGSEAPDARRWRASLLNNLGWTYHERGEYERALALFERAAAAREQQGQARPLRIARWCVARALRSLGRVEQALALQEVLARELERDGDSDGYVDEELGECLLALGRDEQSTAAFRRAFERLRSDPGVAANEPERLARLERLSRRPN
jgi:tetratricopeptide (TPR) repeat protein